MEPHRIWIEQCEADQGIEDDLPRVLLIGDSITRGYFSEVEKRLVGKEAQGAAVAESVLKCLGGTSGKSE